MNSRYDSDLQELHQTGENDREISLGTSTILGIFLALALLCAVFFGFGYGMGRRSSQALSGNGETATATDSSGPKPSPGSPANRAAPKSSANKAVVDENDAPTADASPSVAISPVAAKSLTNSKIDASTVPVTPPRPTVSSASTPLAGAGTTIVQIAAVSHKEDADVLVNELKKHGYSVAIRQEPQDKLLHVQIGPFPSKKEADAMKQRLLADGYNAIVK